MEFVGLAVTLVISLITVAVSWGDSRARNEESRKEAQNADAARKAEIQAVDAARRLDAAAMEVKIKDMTTKDHCTLKHSHLDQNLGDIKGQLKDIMVMLKDLSDR